MIQTLSKPIASVVLCSYVPFILQTVPPYLPDLEVNACLIVAVTSYPASDNITYLWETSIGTVKMILALNGVFDFVLMVVVMTKLMTTFLFIVNSRLM